ncbi:hypothetical protein [Bacteroides sp.]|uniref:hyaluronate lyase N-terminal domain-containing protein n=1 Tax=Bacteroides sp. TaxID=29523 RepID=UPI002605FA0E|nr:hypothetical protein [Bacteroides sp.]MDD3039599.1 hypothetical protein [Bacteroides sp.]
MAYKIQIRRDTEYNWALYNPVLDDGEMGYETDTKKLKIGDGTSAWNDLEYFFVPPTDITESHTRSFLLGGL